MWRNSLKGARDLFLADSSDGGRTFSPAEKLGRGTWPLNACPMDGGAVAVGPAGPGAGGGEAYLEASQGQWEGSESVRWKLRRR
ncbi:hypothetical protein HK102_011471, partial [Quaeritorhiza haematococci]